MRIKFLQSFTAVFVPQLRFFFLPFYTLKATLLSVLLFGAFFVQTQAQTPIADYPFNGNANDESGNGHNATVNGGATLTDDRFGNPNSAYLFDGMTGFIDVSGVSSTAFSISFWFQANSITAANNSPDLQSIYYLYNTAGGTTAHSTARLKASKIDVVQLSSGGFESYSEAFNDNRWHHMVVTGSTTQATTIYIDNQLKYTGEMGFTGWTDLVLGYSRFGGGTDFFDGAIDDVKVFSDIIDASDVEQLYMENGWPINSNETDIISFSLPGQAITPTINTDMHEVDVEVVFGTDPANLIATFELSAGATATVNTIGQTSAVTSNDFSNPLVYQILAEDGFTTQSWLASVTVLPDMIAFYPFLNNTNDVSGNSNDGVLNGGVSLTEDRFSNASRAYSFDGVDGNIFSSALELKDAFSASIWFKTSESFTSNYAVILNLLGYFELAIANQNEVRALIRNGAGDNYEVVNGTSLVADNTWHHATVVFDGTNFELYVDGTKESESPTADFKEFTSYEMRIGSNEVGDYWDGFIDDVRIYGRTITEQEITDLYTEGNWPLTPDPTESILARTGLGDIDADGVSFETITVQLRDEAGSDIPLAGVAVELTALEGSTDNDSDLFIDPNGLVADANGSMTVQTDGTGLATVRLTNSEIEQLSVTARIDTNDDSTVDAIISGGTSPLLINYVIGAPSVAATGSVISSSGPSTLADGTSAITVTVQLKDVLGRDITQSGVRVQFVTTGSARLSSMAGSTVVTTNGNGQASVEVTNTVIETINLRAFLDVDNSTSFEDPDEQIISGGNSNGTIAIPFVSDPTPAFISNLAITQVDKIAGIDMELQSTENGTVYWIINVTGVIPEATAVKDGSAATNGSGSFSITTPDFTVSETIVGSNLINATRYELYLVHEDVDGNFSTVENIAWTADDQAPMLSSASIDPNTPTTIRLVFSEELAFDIVAGITLTNDSGDIIPFSSGATGPTLNFGLTLSQEITDSDTLFVTYDASAGSFEDIASNPLGNFTEKVLLDGNNPSEITLDLTLVQVNMANAITINHTSSASGKLKWLITDSNTLPVLSDFSSQNAGGFGIDSITVSSTSTIESIIQATGLVDGTTYYLFAVAEDSDDNTSEIKSISWTADASPPEIQTATVVTSSPNLVLITFSEEVSSNSGIAGLTISDENGTILSTANQTLLSPTEIQVELSKNIIESDVLTLSYTSVQNEIVDAAQNMLESIADLAVTNNVVTIPPILSNVEITMINGVESIDITLQSDQKGMAYWLVAETGGSFTTDQIKNGIGINAGFGSFEIAEVDLPVTANIAPLILANDRMFDLHVFVEDSNGAPSSIEVLTWDADGKAPTMVSADVSNDSPSQVIIVFDEALVYDDLVGFSFDFIGSLFAIVSIEAIDSVTLAINLSGPMTQADQAFLSYASSAGSLSDIFGNVVRDIEMFEVNVDILDPPANISNLEILNINELISIDLRFQSNKIGKMYWVVTNSSATPSEIVLKTGGTDNFGNGVFDITVVDEPVIETLTGEGLDYQTAYYLHIVHEDELGNLSDVSSLPWVTPKGPPTIEPVEITDVQSLEITLQYSSSNEESLVIHYAIYNQPQPNINTLAILSGLAANEGELVQFETLDANPNGVFTLQIFFENELSAVEHFIYLFAVNELSVQSEIATESWQPVRESGTDPLIRNLITPNGDGENDRLYIENLELYEGQHTVHFSDRNGKSLFTIENFSNDNVSIADDFERLDSGPYICILVLADGTRFMQSITLLK